MERDEALASIIAEADACMGRGDYSAARQHYEQVLAEGGGSSYVYFRLGDAFCAMKEFARALPAYEQGLLFEPERPSLHINIARPLLHLGDLDRAAEHLEFAAAHGRALEAIERLAVIAPGVPGYSQERILEVRQHYGRLLAESTPPYGGIDVARERTPGAPIRVAYLSAHFRQSAYLGPVWGLLNHHDRQGFSIYLLSDSPTEGPFHGYVPHKDDAIVDVSAWADGEIARFIHTEHIDILVDLSGYSHPRRLSLFAHRPAPRVLTWFNMYATSGLPGIDAIVGDAHVVRPGEESYYSERVLRLPQSYLSFQGWPDRPPPCPPPCAAPGPFTFGSLVSLYKVTPPVLDAWAAILRGAPECRLLLGSASLDAPDNRARILEAFQSRGVDEKRLELRGSAKHDEFLRYYDAMDVALDAFPYSGGTTTMEAIWQGVPVLTHGGDRWAARTSGSILVDTHLGEFCRSDTADYIDWAVKLARDPATPAMLTRLRTAMRDNLATAPALDCAALARHMERLYEQECQNAGARE